MTQGAVHFQLFLHQPGDGHGIVVAGGFGDLAAEVALAMLKLAAAQSFDGPVEKLGAERLMLLHDDGHEEGAVVVGKRQGHEIGGFGERLEYGVDEHLGGQALVQMLGAERVVGLLGGIVNLLLTVLILEGEGQFAAGGESLQQDALGFGEG